MLAKIKANITKKIKGHYCDCCEFCGRGRGGVGSTVVGCPIGCDDGGGVSTGGGFHRSYDDLTP